MALPVDDTPFDVRKSGLSLSVDAAALQRCKSLAKRFREQLFQHLVTGERLTIVAVTGCANDDAPAALVRLCEMLSCVAAECDASTASVGLVIDACALPPQAAWLMRRRVLGAGPLYLRLRNLPRGHWLQLWHLRTNRLLRPVYAGSVTSRCGLLAAEEATTILPGVDIQAPVASAWVAIRVDVSRYRTRRAVDEALKTAVELGEQRHASTRWQSPAMRHDAWLNRRLAIEVVGLGDVLRRHGLDPRSAAAFEYLHSYVGRIARVVHNQSRRMACNSGCVPALEQLEPGRTLPGGRLRDGWARRWRAAIESHGVRHRNLFVLQPWSIFPRRGPLDFRFAGLTPMLRHADACSFPRPPSMAHWNVREFIHFHRGASAALQQRDAAHQIAEHV